MTNDKFMFIKTADRATAELLKTQGFKFLHNQNGTHVFVCESNLLQKYALNDKCYFSNTLVF